MYASGGGEDGQWASEGEWDKKGGLSVPQSPNMPGVPYSLPSKEGQAGGGGMVIKDAPNTVEEVPSSKARRWWLAIVWLTTFWIPSFTLRYIGRMKRPDIQLAWREKVTIFWLIFLLNATIIFYIVMFGRLLCPDFDKAWTVNEIAEHTGTNDFYVAVRGEVYDVSNFVYGDHSDVPGLASNGLATLDALAGQDLTYYFPPPLTLACADLVTDTILALTAKNFTDVAPQAMHVSGGSQQSPALSKNDWYTANFFADDEPVSERPSRLGLERYSVAGAGYRYCQNLGRVRQRVVRPDGLRLYARFDDDERGDVQLFELGHCEPFRGPRRPRHYKTYAKSPQLFGLFVARDAVELFKQLFQDRLDRL
jgi:chitin synthase